jgi:hypothetical protein
MGARRATNAERAAHDDLRIEDRPNHGCPTAEPLSPPR